MCSGRVDLAFILRAFRGGADGVIIGGCWPGECHYVTEGNYHALANVHISRKLLERIGVNPERLRLEWISAAEGSRFAEIMSDFAARTRDLGPLGKGEGIDEAGLGRDLEALGQLVPYLKLVEREKLRIPAGSEEAVNELYSSDEVNRLFDELIADKLAISRILLLLKEKPLSTEEISGRLGLSPSEVSRYVDDSSRQGLVRYDRTRNLVESAATG
jgi:coenzyme F420-reducing hydrogenase delta subunit